MAPAPRSKLREQLTESRAVSHDREHPGRWEGWERTAGTPGELREQQLAKWGSLQHSTSIRPRASISTGHPVSSRCHLLSKVWRVGRSMQGPGSNDKHCDGISLSAVHEVEDDALQVGFYRLGIAGSTHLRFESASISLTGRHDGSKLTPGELLSHWGRDACKKLEPM